MEEKWEKVAGDRATYWDARKTEDALRETFTQRTVVHVLVVDMS